jgi:pilin isopeptide linkage protein
MEVVIMKKFKKLLSMLLAATMICSINAMPAYADNEGESGSGSGSSSGVLSSDEGFTTLPFKKVLVTGDATTITNTTFKFTMKPAAPTEEEIDGLTCYEGTPLTTDTVTASVTADSSKDIVTVVNNQNSGGTYVEGFSEASAKGIVLNPEFTLPTFTKTGVYRYIVKESSDTKSEPTITHDQTEFLVDLYVNNDNKIVAIKSQTRKDNQKTPIVFENIFKTSSIRIEKHVNGDKKMDPNTEYTFWVKIPQGGTSIDLAGGTVLNAQIITPGEDPEPVNYITVGGEMPEDDEEDTPSTDNGWCEFTLKDGQALEITGLPAGMVYYVVEDCDILGCTTYVQTATGSTISAPDADTYTLADKTTSVSTTTVAGKNGVYYLNTIDVVASTGVVLDIMPYVVIVLAAAAGILLFISRKKRNAR